MLAPISKLWSIGVVVLGVVTAGFAADRSGAIAVLNFSVPPAESDHWAWAENGMADLLQLELQQQGLRLLDRDLIHAVLNEQRLATSGTTTNGYLALAKLLNARHLIAGRVFPLAGGRFRVEASSFSVEAIETVVSATSEGEFPGEMQPVLQNVAKQLAGKLRAGDASAREVNPAPIGPKPESLIMFYRGLNACAQGQPDWGAACFINAASLDQDFSAPLLWEIKAYEMGGFKQQAAIRREEAAAAVKALGTAMIPPTETPSHSATPVFAVLDPLVIAGAGSMDGPSLGTALTGALLARGDVRVFAFENIGAAVAEQDLKLSSFFASQNAPRYGRWLACDGLVLCRVNPAANNLVSLDLSLVNPLNAAVMARVQQTGPATGLPGRVQGAVKEMMAAWTNRTATADSPGLTAESTTLPGESNTDLRPVYQELALALAQVRREPATSDSHRRLANAFAATGRMRLAAFEIEQCLAKLDIHAPRAATTFLATHRWLFWEPSPASGAVGLVDPRLIAHLIEQLLTVYPHSLAAGCMRYNVAVTAWRAEKWPDAIAQAGQARHIMERLIAPYDRASREGECELVAATYFLEGSSLEKLGRKEEARSVFHQGLDYMQAFKVRDFCVPLGPSIGGDLSAERIYGYGGDRPGVLTRIKQQLVALEGNPVRPAGSDLRRDAEEIVSSTNAPTRTPQQLSWDSDRYPGELARIDASLPSSATNVAPSLWLKWGQNYHQSQRYRAALDCYQKAVVGGVPSADCPELAAVLLEIALDRDLAHPREAIEKLRKELGFAPVEASWVEWFAAGRKYQIGPQYDLEKAVACYRGMLHFLENPEQGGVYHLKKEPGSDFIWLESGSGSRVLDLWSNNYDSRWYSAAFYLAQCLIELDYKEEAAQWLRRIALKAGGDTIHLLSQATWNSTSYQDVQIGVASADLLKELHQELGTAKFGQAEGPFKVPLRRSKARPWETPPLPSLNPQIVAALTNMLAEAARETTSQSRNSRLQAFLTKFGHDSVPAVLSLLPRAGELWDENALIWMLERAATGADAPGVVAACTKRWGLITLAERLDPKATADALAEAWREHRGASFAPPMLIHEILRARVRPLYALVLEELAEKRVNHPVVASAMERVVSQDKSEELEAGFRDALARCLRLKLQLHDYYELAKVSRIALLHGVPEAIDGFLACEGSSPEKLRADLGSVLDLPKSDDEVAVFLRANSSRWEWNPSQKKFKPGPPLNL